MPRFVHLKRERLERRVHAVVTVGHMVYSFGGEVPLSFQARQLVEKAQIDVSVFNAVSLRWLTLPPMTTGRVKRPLHVPPMLIDHTVVLIDGIVYMFGGRRRDVWCASDMLYSFYVDTHTWLKTAVSGAVPGKRYGHSACVLEKAMYIHGGHDKGPNAKTSASNKLDTTTMVWTLINTRDTPPPASCIHSATIIGTKMFVFSSGPWKEFPMVYNNSIRVFDTETNSWLNTPSVRIPKLDYWHHVAFAYNGELYILGGEERHQSDLWKFNPETFSWKEIELKENGPCPNYDMCCCVVRDRIVVFGDYRIPDDMYILDFSPSLKMLCKLAVIQYGLGLSDLPHNIKWELEALTTRQNYTSVYGASQSRPLERPGKKSKIAEPQRLWSRLSLKHRMKYWW